MSKYGKVTNEQKEDFVRSILKKAYSKDPDPIAHKPQVTEESIQKTEKIVKSIKERIK